MEQNFQTSFIPKKPMVRESAVAPRSIGFFTIIAMFILFTVLLSTGALFFYRGIVRKNLTKMEADLAVAKNRFEPAKIAELQVLDKRLIAANEILSKHKAVSPIFQVLQSITMKTVRYTKFSYNVEAEKDPKINVKMSGVATSYSFLALQSDLFSKNKNFINPIFSNLSLNEVGNVVFDLSFSVDPSFVSYKNTILTENQESPNIVNTEAGT